MHRLPDIIDVEASGFGPTSYPIEIGVALTENVRHSLLIRPAPGWVHWDCSAEKIHGVSRKILLESGKSVKEAALQLNLWLQGRNLYTDGWVVDKPWINTLFEHARTPMQFQVSPLEMILTEKQMECWHEVKDAVISEMPLTRHRASHDAWIIQETYYRTRWANASANSIAAGGG